MVGPFIATSARTSGDLNSPSQLSRHESKLISIRAYLASTEEPCIEDKLALGSILHERNHHQLAANAGCQVPAPRLNNLHRPLVILFSYRDRQSHVPVDHLATLSGRCLVPRRDLAFLVRPLGSRSHVAYRSLHLCESRVGKNP